MFFLFLNGIYITFISVGIGLYNEMAKIKRIGGVIMLNLHNIFDKASHAAVLSEVPMDIDCIHGRIIMIDGIYMNTTDKVLETLWVQLSLPTTIVPTWESFKTEIKRIDQYISDKKLFFIMQNMNQFNEEWVKSFVWMFENDILSYWWKSADEKLKVYLFYIEPFFNKKNYPCTEIDLGINTQSILNTVKYQVQNNIKEPFVISYPTLFFKDEKMCFISFIAEYATNRKDGSKNFDFINEPQKYVIYDLLYGNANIVDKGEIPSQCWYDGVYKRFNITPYSIGTNEMFIKSTLAVMDLIRLDYIMNGKHRDDLQIEYMSRLKMMIPKELWEIYFNMGCVKEIVKTKYDFEYTPLGESLIKELKKEGKL